MVADLSISVVSSFSSHGVNIMFSEVSEQDLLKDYLSIDDFISKFFQVVAMVNPDVTCLSWHTNPPQKQHNDRFVIRFVIKNLMIAKPI